MKKLFFLFVCAAIAAACSSEMEVPSPANPDDDMVEVSFNLGGDYVSVEETPMTRADENSFGFTMNDSEWAQESITVK